MHSRAFALSLLPLLAACSAASSPSESPPLKTTKEPLVGTARVELSSQIPVGVDCLSITATGTTTVTQTFSVSSEGTTAFDLAGLPLGNDTFTASAYPAACWALTGVKASYTSNSVTQSIAAGTTPSIALVMTAATGGVATVGVSFPDASVPTPTLYLLPSSRTGSGLSAVTTSYTPTGPIVAGPDGKLWLPAVQTSSTVEYLAHFGALIQLSTAGVFAEFAEPYSPLGAIAAGPDGNLWTTQGAGINRVTTAGVTTTLDVTGDGGVATAIDIVTGSDGNLWFSASAATASIGRITPTGFATLFALPTAAGNPQGIASSTDGNLWVVEAAAAKIARVTTLGAATEYPVPSGVLNSIVAGPDGNLWFTDGQAGGRVGRVTPSGVFTEFEAPGVGASDVVAAGPDGNVWFTAGADAAIGRITPAGVATEFPTGAAYPPLGLTAGPDGNIWFTTLTQIGVLPL